LIAAEIDSRLNSQTLNTPGRDDPFIWPCESVNYRQRTFRPPERLLAKEKRPPEHFKTQAASSLLTYSMLLKGK
jgi:hypothetical protein